MGPNISSWKHKLNIFIIKYILKSKTREEM